MVPPSYQKFRVCLELRYVTKIRVKVQSTFTRLGALDLLTYFSSETARRYSCDLDGIAPVENQELFQCCQKSDEESVEIVEIRFEQQFMDDKALLFPVCSRIESGHEFILPQDRQDEITMLSFGGGQIAFK